MVDSFLSIYPDKESHLLWESEPVPFYLSPAIVRSRADRYKIVPSSSKPGTSVLRVYSAVSCTFLPPPFFFIIFLLSLHLLFAHILFIAMYALRWFHIWILSINYVSDRFLYGWIHCMHNHILSLSHVDDTRLIDRIARVTSHRFIT